MTDETISPFVIDVPDADVADLRARLGATRWPAESPDADWVRGVPGDYLRRLATYWRDDYDWRVHERRLNELPQFTTYVDGQRIHFVHVRSPEPGAKPLVLTHGWPGSVVEFLDVVGPLTDPVAHGGVARDAFHVVAPSIPGFAFSGPVTEPGWDVTRIAAAQVALMARLGYDRYAVQGGDWGSMISREMGVLAPDHVLGVHLNMLMTRPGKRTPLEGGPTPEEEERLAVLDRFVSDGSAYQAVQGTRPQTLAYGLTDSPVGQLAWIVEKFREWTDNDGLPEDAVDLDLLLTNVSIYWFTATAGSSAQIYYERAHSAARPQQSSVPTGVAVFPHDIALPLRRLAEQRDTIVRWTELDRGGHFAAMEEPDLLLHEIRETFRDLD